MFIPSQAPDKDEAYQFMDYILQPENANKNVSIISDYHNKGEEIPCLRIRTL